MQNSVVVRYPKRCGFRKRIKYGNKLESYGLKKTDKGDYRGEVSSLKIASFERYCKRHKLKLCINSSYSSRGNKYRDKFFSSNPPAFLGMYFCAYCGRPIRKSDVTVDHLYPVGKVSADHKLQRRMKRMGIRGVNDSKNLVAACLKCNQQKGKNTGIWVLKGRIGRHACVWYILHALRISIILGALYWLISTFI